MEKLPEHFAEERALKEEEIHSRCLYGRYTVQQRLTIPFPNTLSPDLAGL